jgi:hypothetical protein
MVSGYGAFRSAYIFSTTGLSADTRSLYRVSPLTLRGNDGGRAAFVYVQRPFSFDRSILTCRERRIVRGQSAAAYPSGESVRSEKTN